MDSQIPETVTRLLDQAAYPKNAHYALAALQDVRMHLGFVPNEALPIIAERMGMDLTAVIALVVDSAQFPGPAPVHLLRVCQGAVCVGKNGHELLAAIRHAFVGYPDLKVMGGYCLGHCTEGPAVELDGDVMAPVDLESVLQRVKALD